MENLDFGKGFGKRAAHLHPILLGMPPTKGSSGTLPVLSTFQAFTL